MRSGRRIRTGRQVQVDGWITNVWLVKLDKVVCVPEKTLVPPTTLDRVMELFVRVITCFPNVWMMLKPHQVAVMMNKSPPGWLTSVLVVVVFVVPAVPSAEPAGVLTVVVEMVNKLFGE